MKHEWITMHLDAPTRVQRPSLIQGGGGERGASFQKFLAMQKLKKAALVAIAAKLTQDEVGSLGDIFRHLDKEGDGVMTLTELDDAISGGKTTRSCTRLTFWEYVAAPNLLSLVASPSRAGQFPAEIQQNINSMKAELSLTGNDTLNWKAFLTATMDKNLVMREDKIRLAFDHFKHSDGDCLTLEDFIPIFPEGEAQAKEIFNYLDNNGDGKVSFDDFRNAMEECIDVGKEQ
jgi:calcium-dependent protein kinase